MKTVDNILRGMRRLADEAERGDCYDLRGLGTDSLRSYADLIEEAMKRELEATRDKSSQVGNAAAMREALEALVGVIDKCDSGDPLWWHIGAKGVKPLKDARAALSAPPRNCDIMDWRTAWAKWRTECHPQKPCGYAEVVSGTEQFMDWYMSEAKGETK